MYKNDAALFCKSACSWRKTLQVACTNPFACTWGSLSTHSVTARTRPPLRLYLNLYTASEMCTETIRSPSIITPASLFTPRQHVLKAAYSRWLSNFGLADSCTNYPDHESQKGDDMASEMLNSLMRVWNGNYCSSWPFTTLLGRAECPQ